MRSYENAFGPEHGGAGVKFLLIFVVLILAANAGYNYVPVAYNGASFRQEMDTAVVKGLAATGRMKPMDIVTASINRAMSSNNVPDDAVVEITAPRGVVEAHVSYSQEVNMLPFGLFKYRYEFDHTARPTGYLAEDKN